MARVRVPDKLRDQVREYNNQSEEYDTIAEFTKDAIRRLLDQKTRDPDKEEIKEEIIEEIKQDLKEV